MDLTKIYRDIEDLPLYNFDKIDTTGDLMWLYEDFNGRQPKTDTSDLKPIYDNIFNQYFEALEDRSVQLRIQKEAKIQQLAMKIEIVTRLVQRIYLGFGSSEEQQKNRASILEQLKNWGYEIPLMNTAYDDALACEKIMQRLKSVNNQIAIIQNEIKNDKGGQSVKLQKQMYIVSKALFNGVPIKPKEVSVAWWIEAIKDLQHLQESQNN